MKLTDPLSSVCRFEGKKYRLKLSFDRVLKAYDLLEDDLLLPFEKTQAFVYTLCPKAYRLSDTQLLAFAKQLVEEHIAPQKSGGSGTKTVDFTQDANYIFASFKQAYNIDLQASKIHWNAFTALFSSLPESTKIREIMSIRARPIPARNKHNATEIQNLLKLKEFYALHRKPSGENNFNDGLATLFQILKERAVM